MRPSSTRIWFSGCILVLSSMVSGCATIVHLGGSEELSVTSDPSGATVVIDGTERGVTPLATTVERKKDHAVLIQKDGFEDTQRRVESKLSAWIAGNLVLGGLVGLLVDVMSGGGYTIEPDVLAVTLTPGTGTPAAPSVSSFAPPTPQP